MHIPSSMDETDPMIPDGVVTRGRKIELEKLGVDLTPSSPPQRKRKKLVASKKSVNVKQPVAKKVKSAVVANPKKTWLKSFETGPVNETKALPKRPRGRPKSTKSAPTLTFKKKTTKNTQPVTTDAKIPSSSKRKVGRPKKSTRIAKPSLTSVNVQPTFRDDREIVTQKIEDLIKRKPNINTRGNNKRFKRQEPKSSSVAKVAKSVGQKRKNDAELKVSIQKRRNESAVNTNETVEYQNSDNSEDDTPRKIVFTKFPERTKLSQEIVSKSEKQMVMPSVVVRPVPFTHSDTERNQSKRENKRVTYKTDPKIWVQVFKWLDPKSMNAALQVSKDWNQMGMNPKIWKTIDLSGRLITKEILQGVVRRQPSKLLLNWAKLSKVQFDWLMKRLPQLDELHLQGLSWNVVSALRSCYCPALSGLDLGYVANLNVGNIRELFKPPIGSRPGLDGAQSLLPRLRNLRYLNVAGSEITDLCLKFVMERASLVEKLDLSGCPRITNAGMAYLASPESSTSVNLTHLVIAGCRSVTDEGIAYLASPESPLSGNLTHLNLTSCPELTDIIFEHLFNCRQLVRLTVKDMSKVTIFGINRFCKRIKAAQEAGLRLVDTKVEDNYKPEDFKC